MRQTAETYVQTDSKWTKTGHVLSKWCKRLILFTVLILILLSAAECGIHAFYADNFFTLASIPTGSCPKTAVYQRAFGNDETFVLAENFHGETIFRHPATAFAKMEKECAPLLEEMKKGEKLPAFSATTYRKYLSVFGQPPAYPGHNEIMVEKVYCTCTTYLNSTQLTFGPKKDLMDSSR